MHSLRLRRRTWVISAVVIAALALTGGGVALWQQERDRAAQQAELESWRGALTASTDAALAALPDPPLQLAPLIGGAATETADQLAELRAVCEHWATDATRIASLEPAPPAPGALRETTPGFQEAAAAADTATTAITTFQGAVGGLGAQVAGFCDTYPGLVEIQLDQAAATVAFDSLLGECTLEEHGCIPLDTADWPALADAVGPAFTDPAQRRADLYGAGCPTAELADVCSLLSAQYTSLVPLYEAYATALRDGDRAVVTSSRDAIATEIGAQQAALAQAVAVALPGGSEQELEAGPAAVVAQAVAQWAIDTDRERLAAEAALLQVVG